MAVPNEESPFIYGMHDRGGEHLMRDDGKAKGWVLITEELRANPNDMGGSNYSDLANKDFGVMVRLNHAYGPDGTIPLANKYQDFAQRVANFVGKSPGAHIWIIGNEMNLEREQPRKPGSNEAEPITPRRYATCYKLCRDAIRRLPGHRKDQVIIGAIGPWNPETPYEADPEGKYSANKLPGAPGNYPYFGFFGDYIKYLRDILITIGPDECDGIAIHAYTHGTNPDLVFSNQKMNAPFDKYNFHFRTYRDQMNAIPQAFRHLPVYLTEMDEDEAWDDANRGWVKNAYKEINEWNRAGHQQIRAGILYRWPKHDKWNIDGKRGVQDDFREAINFNYKWDPDVASAGTHATPTPLPTEAGSPTVPIANRPPYRTRYTGHNTPTTVPVGQTLNLTVVVQNMGSITWTQGGATPFRLGFQWYNAAGQMLTLPPQLDFHTPLPADVPPDGAVTLQAQLRTPDTPGAYQLRWDMIQEQVTWFTSQGDQGLLVSPITVTTQPVQVTPTPIPVPVPTPTPVPTSTLIQVQDVSASLPRSATQQYPTRTRSAIRRLIVHHTATPANVTIQRVADFQVNNRNLPGITYHYCITAQGQVFQTQPLETVSSHAGSFNADSVGVCLIGNFTEAPPPQPQLDAAAALLAQLARQLGIPVNQIVGYNELVNTGSPGATWPAWKGPLLAKVQSLLAGAPVSVPTPTPTPIPTPTPAPTPAAAKTIEHYMLFWHRSAGNWARWDLLGAFAYIDKFPVTVGFSIEEAKSARHVTIVGGPGGVPSQTEQILRAAGCQVERLAGGNETETRQMLEQLAAQGQRYRTLR